MTEEHQQTVPSDDVAPSGELDDAPANARIKNDGDGEATNNAEFQTLEYWDRRYRAKAAQGEQVFEWFKGYEEIRDTLTELIPDRNARILMLGCGNSGLSADMVADGYSNITNLDFSTVVIEQMKEQHPGQDWRVMDVRELKEHADELGGEGSWDVIIDKGTLDALMAEKGSVWAPSDAVLANVAAEIDGVLALLKPSTGRFLYLTFGQPHFRRPHLEREGRWTIEVRTTGDMFHYFWFIGRKS
ncbi:unnamed protein product [Tilletia controversa]|uniref:Methyltransferase domain-containing protein n=3 Tax=Tilletia TaxID=13289 RepID=A0A8X7MYH5_9BASI|nr:hypothetical protein CF336_g1102 [Tilletia laevis]KAE8205503.1 hypothetical protein CF328_g454 [Tilletia controversa]KAE8265443.1 hypothetical protein A4X03_0g263 [Tilletia caries]KAE8208155.1 hypothetical protein CF335_g624 [Tilletia laevis]KAE8253573.1 hypothetical protein A4X06_0g1357 [Tilletia controversa]